jgi:hypothetical protein
MYDENKKNVKMFNTHWFRVQKPVFSHFENMWNELNFFFQLLKFLQNVSKKCPNFFPKKPFWDMDKKHDGKKLIEIQKRR